MNYIKVFILFVVMPLAIVFMVQNIESLSQPVAIRFNLIFIKFELHFYAVYLLILLSFVLGVLIGNFLGIAERFRLRKEIKTGRKGIESLNHELNSLQNFKADKHLLIDDKNKKI